MKMEQDKDALIFDIEGLDILTAVDNDVYVRGYNDDNQCVFIIPRHVLMSSLNDWLDHKREYWNNWHHFCGVGYLYTYDYVESQQISLRIIGGDEMECVNSYKIFSFEVDMEHG